MKALASTLTVMMAAIIAGGVRRLLLVGRALWVVGVIGVLKEKASFSVQHEGSHQQGKVKD
jgi:type IV secretory pathway VirB3-like protein